MAFRDALRRIAGASQTEVLGLFDRFQEGGISEGEFTAATAAVIARADGRAVRVADRAMAIQLSRLLRRDIPPEPTVIDNPAPRLRDSVRTLLADHPEIATTAVLLADSQRKRLARLARSEPLTRGQEAIQTNLKRNRVGWVRSTGPDPCPFCTDLDDGVVRSADVDMAAHAGCSCVQQPAEFT